MLRPGQCLVSGSRPSCSVLLNPQAFCSLPSVCHPGHGSLNPGRAGGHPFVQPEKLRSPGRPLATRR